MDITDKLLTLYVWAAALLPPVIVILTFVADRTKTNVDNKAVAFLSWARDQLLKLSLPTKAAKTAAGDLADRTK
jgi:hypothetical protein